jgi:hypothetical protein
MAIPASEGPDDTKADKRDSAIARTIAKTAPAATTNEAPMSSSPRGNVGPVARRCRAITTDQ